MDRFYPLVLPKSAGELPTDNGPHAVAIEGKRPVQKRKDSRGEGFQEKVEAGDRIIHEAVFPARQLDGKRFDSFGKAGPPVTEGRCSGARIREIEKSECSRRVLSGDGADPGLLIF